MLLCPASEGNQGANGSEHMSSFRSMKEEEEEEEEDGMICNVVDSCGELFNPSAPESVLLEF